MIWWRRAIVILSVVGRVLVARRLSGWAKRRVAGRPAGRRLRIEASGAVADWGVSKEDSLQGVEESRGGVASQQERKKNTDN